MYWDIVQEELEEKCVSTQKKNSPIAFTICTISHLPRALTLAEGMAEYAPDFLFFMVLIDPLRPEVNRVIAEDPRIVPIDKLQVGFLEALKTQYDPAEISFLLKPVVFRYFFERFPQSPFALYFDSDVMLYHPLRHIEPFLDTHDVVLTPHLLSPYGFDGKTPDEFDTLRTGYFNMGFAAMANRLRTLTLLDWWQERMVHHGHANRAIGLSADQFWMTFAPYYFDKIFIDPNPGMNVAYWNLHERNLSESDGMILVNKEHPLIFIHFSGFDPQIPHHISDPLFFNRFDGIKQPVFARLCRRYAESLLANHYTELSRVTSDWLSKPELLEAKCREAQSRSTKVQYALVYGMSKMPEVLRRRLWRLALLFISHSKY